MNRIFIFTLLLLTFLQGQTKKNDYYPTTEKDRPLILYKGKLEIDGGIAFLSKHDDYVKPFINVRYAITENLEIERIGLRYRFYNKGDWQSAAVLENYGFSKENDIICYHSKFELEAKYISKSYYALLFQGGYYFAEGKNDGKSDELRLTFAVPIKLFYSNTFTMTSGLRFYNYEAYGNGNAFFFKITATQNIVNTVDFVLEMALSTFHEAADAALFNESYGKQINFRLRWRFL